MILNSLDLFHETLSVNQSNLVKLVYQTDSYFSPWTKRRLVSILASDKGDRLWWRIGNCFLNPEILPTVPMAGGSLFHCVVADTVKLGNLKAERLFYLDEEIDRQFYVCDIALPN